VIDVDGLVAGYGGSVALHGISFSVRSGSLAVLLGASGAGKTTLLRALCGLVAVQAGRIQTEHGDVADAVALRAHRADVGWIVQSPSLVERLSALDNVVLGRLSRKRGIAAVLPWSKVDREAAAQAMEEVGILHLALRRADSLSGGERQRVAVARALSGRPRLLLADEPTANLDPEASRGLIQTIRELCTKRGLTAILSSHEVDTAVDVADQVFGLRQGRVVLDSQGGNLASADLAFLYAGAEPAGQARKPHLAWSSAS
jgi:phosphonate transport system ATP-binding protein